MTRNHIALIFFFLTLSLNAQTDHKRFADIPLCETIEHFQTQLESKGFVAQKLINKQLAVGSRLFKGIFAGRAGNVVAYYDTKDKEVYSAKVFYEGLTKQMAVNKQENLETLLEMKYGEENTKESTDNNNNPTFTVTTPVGIIVCYLMCNADLTDYSYHWSTHVEFVDVAGFARHNANMLDDF